MLSWVVLFLIALRFVDELAWARLRYPHIYERVEWRFARPMPRAFTPDGHMIDVQLAEYHGPLPPFVPDRSSSSPASYRFQPADFTIVPQPCQSSLVHYAFIPISYDGPLPTDSTDQLGSLLAKWIKPLWTETKTWLDLLSPYHTVPPPFHPCDIEMFLSQYSSWNASTWAEVRRLGLELQALSTMLMKRAIVLLSLYNRVLPPKWPTEVWLVGTFMEMHRRSEFADAEAELHGAGPPCWYIHITDRYFTNDPQRFSNDDEKCRTNRRRSAALRAAVTERSTPWKVIYTMEARVYPRSLSSFSFSNPFYGMRDVRDEVGSPQWCYRLRNMIFDVVRPGFAGQSAWHEIHIRLANLLRLPLEYDRPSVLSLERVGDDRIMKVPPWCMTVPRLLQKACVWHLPEDEAVVYFNHFYQCEPPARPVSPSAPPGYRPPAVVVQKPPSQLPQPNPPASNVIDLSDDTPQSTLDPSPSPVVIDLNSNVIQKDDPKDMDIESSPVSPTASPSVANPTIHTSSLTPATTSATIASASPTTADPDIGVVLPTSNARQPIPASTWYFVGVGPIRPKESGVAEFLASYCHVGALGARIAVEAGTKERSMRLLFKSYNQAEALVRAYEETSFEGGVPGVTSAWMTRPESIGKYHASADLEYLAQVLARNWTPPEAEFLLKHCPPPYTTPAPESVDLSKREKNLAKKRRLFDHFIELSLYPAVLQNDPWAAAMDVRWEPDRSKRMRRMDLVCFSTPAALYVIEQQQRAPGGGSLELIRFGLTLQRFGMGSPLRLVLPLTAGPYSSVVRFLGRSLHTLAGDVKVPPSTASPDQVWASSNLLENDSRHAEESLSLGSTFWTLCIELNRDVPYYYFPLE